MYLNTIDWWNVHTFIWKYQFYYTFSLVIETKANVLSVSIFAYFYIGQRIETKEIVRCKLCTINKIGNGNRCDYNTDCNSRDTTAFAVCEDNIHQTKVILVPNLLKPNAYFNINILFSDGRGQIICNPIPFKKIIRE